MAVPHTNCACAQCKKWKFLAGTPAPAIAPGVRVPVHVDPVVPSNPFPDGGVLIRIPTRTIFLDLATAEKIAHKLLAAVAALRPEPLPTNDPSTN